ncbi:MAG: chemotaxis protein CheW [Candidatus Ozemobacteraceae bacterium]
MNGSDVPLELELVVLCSIGTSHFGIPARRVQEIIRRPTVRVVHHTASFVLGVFNLRGRIVELIDPGRKLGLEDGPFPADSRIMVLNSAETIVGILVHSVIGVFPFEASSVKPIPENLPATQREMISGFLKIDEKVVAFLDVDALLKTPPVDKKVLVDSIPHQ